MAREEFLGPAEYGALAALTSLLYLGGISAATLTTTTANYAAGLLGRKQTEYIGQLIHRLSRQALLLGLVLGVLIIGLSPFLAKQLHLSSIMLPILLAPILLLALLAAIAIGALQGLAAFGALAFVLVGGAGFRLLLSVLLVGPLRQELTGALLAAILATCLMYIIAWLPLRPYLKRQRLQPAQTAIISWRELFSYTHSVFWIMFGITSLFSIDIVLAQHYLNNQAASLYGALSTLGRIIYFTTLPLTMIMFPLVTQRFVAANSSRKIIILSGFSVIAVGLILLIIYAASPQLVIGYTVGKAYLEGSSNLWLFGLFFCVVSTATWLMHVFLARQITLVAYLAPAAVILQIVLISRWHSSPQQIITGSLIAASSLMLGLLISLPLVKSEPIKKLAVSS